jgi:hypothetical protein
MNRMGFLVFRILLGMIFVAQYFFGGNYGQGNKFLLLFGALFIGYGLFGLIQITSKRR